MWVDFAPFEAVPHNSYCWFMYRLCDARSYSKYSLSLLLPEWRKSTFFLVTRIHLWLTPTHDFKKIILTLWPIVKLLWISIPPHCKSSVPIAIRKIPTHENLWAARCWVRILSLPVIPEVILGGHSSSSLTVPKCKIGTRSRSGNKELTQRIIMHKQEKNAGNDGYTLALKPMDRVNQKSWNREHQWLHKMVTCHRKFCLKIW